MPFEYDFEITTETDFKLKVTFEGHENRLNSLFFGAKKALLLKQVIVPDNLDKIERWNMPQDMPGRMMYIGVIKKAINNSIREIGLIVKKDGYTIINWDIADCNFRKTADKKIMVDIDIVGVYSRGGRYG